MLTIRLFIELSQQTINNTLFIVLGIIVIAYILVSLGYTYRFRKDLVITEEKGNTFGNKRSVSPISEKIEKERMKLEKKKHKTLEKQVKKTHR